MTDTKPLAPIDKQLEDFAVEEQFLLFCDADEFTQIARAARKQYTDRASHGQAPAQEAPAAVDHDEDLLEKLYWEFDSQRKKTGEERLAFKVKMRFYASEFLRRSDGKMTFAQSVSDDMMNLADRLGSEFDDVDPRAWKHLLVYAPKAALAARAPADSVTAPQQEAQEPALFVSAKQLASLTDPDGRRHGRRHTVDWHPRRSAFGFVGRLDHSRREGRTVSVQTGHLRVPLSAPTLLLIQSELYYL